MIDEFKEKAKETMLQRYGVKHTLQHKDLKEKASASYSNFKA